MEKHVFLRLCCTLESLDLLHEDRYVGVQESIAIFLFIVSQSIRVRVATERFQQSKDTIHRQFKCVLRDLCEFSPHIVRTQIRGATPPEIASNPKYFPSFEVRY